MKRVLTLLLCVAMVLSVSACKKEEKKEATKTTAPSTTTTTEYYEKTYAHNEIINRFFTEYLAKYNNIDTSTIRRDPNKPDNTVYLAVIGECNVTITDVSQQTFSSGMRYALQIEIEGGTTTKDRDALLSVFTKIALTTDTSLSQANASKQMEAWKDATQRTGMTRVSTFVWADYSPIYENTEMNVYTPCRMVMRIIDPRILESSETTASTN